MDNISPFTDSKSNLRIILIIVYCGLLIVVLFVKDESSLALLNQLILQLGSVISDTASTRVEAP